MIQQHHSSNNELFHRLVREVEIDAGVMRVPAGFCELIEHAARQFGFFRRKPEQNQCLVDAGVFHVTRLVEVRIERSEVAVDVGVVRPSNHSSKLEAYLK